MAHYHGSVACTALTLVLVRSTGSARPQHGQHGGRTCPTVSSNHALMFKLEAQPDPVGAGKVLAKWPGTGHRVFVSQKPGTKDGIILPAMSF